MAESITLSSELASYSRRVSPASVGFQEEKLTHLHFYLHDVITGPNPSVVTVAEPLKDKSNSPLPFGTVVMIDDRLTVAPEPDSELVGKAQGFYASSSQDGVGLTMTITFVFTEGTHNGSTLSLLGRNMLDFPVREMPIVGGTGDFRFARGFAQAKTHSLDFTTGNGIEEFDVYVFHYFITDSSSS
ncbi:pterocarpan synthase 1-like [Gastrolobium bilobum]|uniref:pterocarpan synthase 1-like n=1 Tax=Gastrolobium bilobum TaxID=150636 RepID=UPI002AB10C4A|nr:pterocarpan synthase 1-like [Gastrolobium bilobum]